MASKSEPEKEKSANWHRLLGLILHPLFDRMGGDTKVEIDLSFKTQRADIITVRRETDGWKDPSLPEDFWRVFDSFNDHNIITFKSYSEVFNGYAMEELYGHLINYGKVENVAHEKINLYAIVHHYPRDLLTPFLAAGLAKVSKADEVYDLEPGVLKPVRIIVCRTTDNPLLALFSNDKDTVFQGYERIATESNLLAEVSDYLDRIKQYFGEMVKNMYTKEDFLRDYPPSEGFNIVFPWEEKMLDEVRAEGLEEGRKEGQQEALLLTIRRVAALRFEVELDHFAEVLEKLNVAEVKHLSEVVFEVETLAAFEEATEEALARLGIYGGKILMAHH